MKCAAMKCAAMKFAPMRGFWKNPVYGIIVRRTLEASVLALLVHWLFHWPLTGPHALGLFLAPALCLYFVFVFVAPWSWGLPILTRLRARAREIVLTIDDGPSPEVTPRILDALRGADACAVFFVLGEAVDRHPDLLRQIVADGHQVGIHGYHHRAFVLLTHAQMRLEVAKTQAAIIRACPEAAPSVWVRPPHGFKSLGMVWLACRERWRLAAWSVDGRDYRETDPARVTKIVLRRLCPGAVVLLHDGPAQAVTAEALPQILRGLETQGFRTALLPR